MRIKTIYDKLKPEFKTELQVSARKYSTAKRLKYILMSKTSWYDLTINDVSDMTVYCNVKLYNMSGSDIMYGKSMLKD